MGETILDWTKTMLWENFQSHLLQKNAQCILFVYRNELEPIKGHSKKNSSMGDVSR